MEIVKKLWDLYFYLCNLDNLYKNHFNTVERVNY